MKRVVRCCACYFGCLRRERTSRCEYRLKCIAAERIAVIAAVAAVVPDGPELVAGAGGERAGPRNRWFVIGLRRSRRAGLRARHGGRAAPPARAVPSRRRGRWVSGEVDGRHVASGVGDARLRAGGGDAYRAQSGDRGGAGGCRCGGDVDAA